MCRWITVLLLVFLPLQLSWAAVGRYCQHETDVRAARHFGHHAHVHQGSAGAAAQARATGAESRLTPTAGASAERPADVSFGSAATAEPAADLPADPAAGGKSMIDSDCNACHAGVPATLAPAAVNMPQRDPGAGPDAGPAAQRRSVPARTPDRPQWARLAA